MYTLKGKYIFFLVIYQNMNNATEQLIFQRYIQ